MTLRRALPAAALTLALSGNLLAGQAAPRDLAQEEANRALVLSFYNQFFNEHDTAAASKLITDDYRQHNPHVPDGKAPMVEYFTEFFKTYPDARAKVVRSATDGDLVYLHVHSTDSKTDRGVALVDIFRVEDGRIVEHWDVIQPVPEKAANTNTMF
ncbi:nuclear transport factor 2 family protein [Pseudomonas sp. 5P_3.1_Bac2]|uniref:nuclear transport factor 2 family protein n=1 Tax=Pseudomonas sp. 5P_3.1_Bac2 TaxID=2971617 RepID=UPI0021CA174F|nr:nuclear transport factor 2 family protein [Pseudomonas sp. 5P_3.1_Bac2]MCU1717904.1 nuclear transport factor 2 family protein [Pseudomonas sp. 5P_3.1_Bac2]